VLSLFFIDEVVKYRDYAAKDDKGEYARIRGEYELYQRDSGLKSRLTPCTADISTDRTHSGYFSIDKKTTP
jgi:type III restriction enzyme